MSSAIIQISDTHFGTELAQVERALFALIRAESPSAIIISGDVTQRARRLQFRAARRFLDSLGGVPVVAVPGNHDIPLFALATRCLRPYGHWREVFGADLEPVLSNERLLVQCVNTTRWFRHKHGQISEAQTARVAERLHQASHEQLRVVVAHHPCSRSATAIATTCCADTRVLSAHGWPRVSTSSWAGTSICRISGPCTLRWKTRRIAAGSCKLERLCPGACARASRTRCMSCAMQTAERSNAP